MTIIPRERPKSSEKIQANLSYSFNSLLAKILCQFPTLICLIVFIYICYSSTTITILSGNGVHVCVSSRKLNNLYCLGSTQPIFQIVDTKAAHIVEWQMEVMKYDRRNLLGFAAAARPGSLDSIRSVLMKQCVSAKDERYCKFLDCSSGQCDEPEPVIAWLAMESEFCLQPMGDNTKRRSIFESLVSGCIPVVFEPFTSYYKLTWHAEKYSVFIDKEELRNGSVNVVEMLTRLPAMEREKMRRYIVYTLMPRLVYGVGFQI